MHILKIRIGSKACDVLGLSQVGMDNLSYMLGKEECHHCRRYTYRLWMVPIRIEYQEGLDTKKVMLWACSERHAVKAMMPSHPKIYDLKRGIIR